MFTSIKDQSLKRFAVATWVAIPVLIAGYALGGFLSAPKMVRSKRESSIPRLSSPSAIPSNMAQFERRSVGSVSEGESGTTGLYLDRFGLRYYREPYPGTDCFGSPLPEIMELDPICVVGGDFHADDIYFPSPKLRWA